MVRNVSISADVDAEGFDEDNFIDALESIGLMNIAFSVGPEE